MRVDDLLTFMGKRHAIYKARQAGKPSPWSNDPILNQYRFCNVYRELDTVTQWIAQNWRGRFDTNVWFAMVVARLVNWPETLAELGYPCANNRFDTQKFINVLSARKARGEKVFTSAYMIHAGPTSGIDKATYLAREVLTPIWAARKELTPSPGPQNLGAWHHMLMTHKDMGSFMAAQIVADVKYAPVCPLRDADDWWTFAAPGPGSKRGLNRVCCKAVDSKWADHEWLYVVWELQKQINHRHKKYGLPEKFHAQDIQNCLCEFDKYERVRLGEGRPRQNFTVSKS